MSDVAMSAVSFAGAIRAVAATMNREPTSEQVDALENVLREKASVKGAMVEVLSDEGTMPVNDFIAAALKPLAPIAAPAGSAQPIVTRPSEPSFSSGRTDFFGNLTRSFAAAEQATALQNALKGPNPWAKGHENRTRQAIVRNLNPTLAEELKIKAGAN